MKRKCAEEALKRIRDHSTIGLGGGSTVSILVKLLAESSLSVKVVTPSTRTAALCAASGLSVVPTWSVDHLPVAFDGCDEVDAHLNALKSGGGIHTNEKIIASMADAYVLLVDETKVFPTLPFTHPLVLEVLPESKMYVEKRVCALGGQPVFRTSDAKDGYTITDHGNYLLDVTVTPPADLAAFHNAYRLIPGVVDISLFFRIASCALVAGTNEVRTLTSE